MLGNIRKIIDGGDVYEYLAEDGYYCDDDAKHNSFWWGGLKSKFKVDGPVTLEDFQRVKAKTIRANKSKNVIGWDLTFSAPKSVSVLALAYGHKRLREACRQALEETLQFVEHECLDVRMFDRKNRTQTRIPVRELLFGVFEHQENRNLDPQLHFHCLLFNKGIDKHGKLKALETQKLFELRLAAGTYFQNQLAFHVRRLGYSTEWDFTKGTFEIKDFPPSVIEEFSTRRQEILQFLSRNPSFTLKQADMAALFTRKKKSHKVDREILRKIWLRRVLPYQEKMANFAKALFVEKSRSALEGEIRSWLNNAISHLQQRNAVFEPRHLVIEILKRSQGRAASMEVISRIRSCIDDGDLVERRLAGSTYLTTVEEMEKEAQLLVHEREGRGKIKPLYALPELARALSEFGLEGDQFDAARQILCTSSRACGIQGYAGTGKTTLLEIVNKLARMKQSLVLGLAPSVVAAKTLQAETAIPSQTLQSFLRQFSGLQESDNRTKLEEARRTYAGSTLIIDEGGMVSSQQLLDLFSVVHTLKVRQVVLVGDREQLKAVDAGQPFSLLQDNGMETAVVRKIFRQREANLKSAVYDVIDRDLEAAFDKLDAHTTENTETDLAYLAAIRWLEMPDDDRKNTLILTQTRAERSLVNQIIRHNLKMAGHLGQIDSNFDILLDRPLTQAQCCEASSFEVGRKVRFHRDYVKLGIRAGDLVEVRGRNLETNTVTLDVRGKEIIWAPHEMAGKSKDAFTLYLKDSLSLSTGDQVRFTANVSREGVYNGTQAHVEEVSEKGVKVRKGSGETLFLEREGRALQHLDYAWASTTHASQGKTVDRVIVVANSNHAQMNNLSAFYVQISRARYAAEILTNDKDQLRKQLQKSIQPKPVHAVELMGRKSLTEKLRELLDKISAKVGIQRESRAWTASDHKQPVQTGPIRVLSRGKGMSL